MGNKLFMKICAILSLCGFIAIIVFICSKEEPIKAETIAVEPPIPIYETTPLGPDVVKRYTVPYYREYDKLHYTLTYEEITFPNGDICRRMVGRNDEVLSCVAHPISTIKLN